MPTFYESSNSGTNVQNLARLKWRNTSTNLNQWAHGANRYDFKNGLHEDYRQNNACNCLRLNGHTDSVAYGSSRGSKVPFSWYSGRYGITYGLRKVFAAASLADAKIYPACTRLTTGAR